MAYPSLTVNLPHLRKNVRTVRRLCEERGIGITAVTKVFEADPVIAKVLVEEGMTILGRHRRGFLRKKTGVHRPRAEAAEGDLRPGQTGL